MKTNFFPSAFSGTNDALSGILTTGRDAACHVSTPTTTTGSLFKRLMVAHLVSIKRFAATCFAVLCLTGTALADDAATIAAYIESVTWGDLQAEVSGATVTVTGTLLGAPSNANFLTLNIDPDVKVIWRASLFGSSGYPLIYISGGSGVFEMQSGIIENNGNGSTIYNNSAGTVNISGGTVSAASGSAISNYSVGELNISGGTVSATTGIAIYSGSRVSSGNINVSGSAHITSASIFIFSSNYASNATIFLNSTCRLVITGGTVENTNNNYN